MKEARKRRKELLNFQAKDKLTGVKEFLFQIPGQTT